MASKTLSFHSPTSPGAVHSSPVSQNIYFKFWYFQVLCVNSYEYDPEQFAGASIPMLVIGTKQDLVPTGNETSSSSRAYSIAEECGADEIRMVSNKSNIIEVHFI